MYVFGNFILTHKNISVIIKLMYRGRLVYKIDINLEMLNHIQSNSNYTLKTAQDRYRRHFTITT